MLIFTNIILTVHYHSKFKVGTFFFMFMKKSLMLTKTAFSNQKYSKNSIFKY